MGLSKIDEKTKPCTRVIKKKLGMRVPHECEGEEQQEEHNDAVKEEAGILKENMRKKMQARVDKNIEDMKKLQKANELAYMKKKIEADNRLANEMMSAEEKNEVVRREKIMARFRRQILNPNYSDNLYMELNITNLKKFYEKSLKEFNDVEEFFSITRENERDVLYYKTDILSVLKNKRSDQRIEFEERCYMTKLTFREVQKFMELQKKRIEDIEETIDQHFDGIKKSILKDKSDKLFRAIKKEEDQKKKDKKSDMKTNRSGMGTSKSNRNSESKNNPEGQDMQKLEEEQKVIQNNEVKFKLQEDPDLQFSNPAICTYAKKLDQLYDFEETLLKNDKTMKENRRGLQTICRLQGSLTQSYFLWDNHEYDLARKIFYELECRPRQNETDNQEEIDLIYQEMHEQQIKQVFRDQQNELIEQTKK